MKTKTNLVKCLRQESGQALLIVLAFLLLGSLTLPPLLSYMGTANKNSLVYKNKTNELYAADSGIEDAIWQIKYDRLGILFYYDDPPYNVCDFSTNWSYNPAPINGLTANVSIKNEWIPTSNVSLLPSDPAEAERIIELNKLMVTGTSGTTPGETYKILINFYPGEEEDPNDLKVESLGIWLPIGFTYVYSSSNLEQADESEPYYSEPEIEDYKGGQAVVWEFSSANFTSFPGVTNLGENLWTTDNITFEFTALEDGTSPTAIAWMETSGSITDVLPVTWDIDTKIYKVTSTAGGTDIETYLSRCELRDMDETIIRKMGRSFAGDYMATGNTLMTGGNPRTTWLAESDAEILDIPNNEEGGYADVVAAYLYWSGWRSENSKNYPLPLKYDQQTDTCSNFDNWNKATTSCWSISSGKFKGRYVSGGDTARYLTLKFGLNLSPYTSANVSWTQSKSGTTSPSDNLTFAFSADGGVHWSEKYLALKGSSSPTSPFTYPIPSQYLASNFRMRFYLAGFGGGSSQYCTLDNIQITAGPSSTPPDAAVVFKIDGEQVYLDAQGEPHMGNQSITANITQVLPNYQGDGVTPNGFSYSCYLDVTKMVKAYAEVVEDEYGNEHHTGNGTYTIGDVLGSTGNNWSYAGWSLIIIYSSPQTAGHRLYLYDDFMYADEETNIDFDNDGEDGGDITDFIIPEPIADEENAATITCFIGEGDSAYDGDYFIFEGTALSDGEGDLDDVWDSMSVVSADGVDIDTFYVTWESDLLEPGETTAHIDLPTEVDSWNLVYIILSLRSETTTGGTTHYVIRGE